MLRIIFGIVITIITVPIFLATPQFALSYNDSKISNENTHESLDMLIFLSPQYRLDDEIISKIKSYTTIVKDHLGWNSKIIPISEKINHFRLIDEIIESYYEKYRIKSCLMVGEDIDTALAGDCNYMEKPSTVPWFTVGGEDEYEISEQGIICKPYKLSICISLLYPPNNLDYRTKKSYILSVFDKFISDRDIVFSGDVLVFESSDINFYSKDIYHGLDSLVELSYVENANSEKIKNSFSESFSMYYVHGHSNPCGSQLDVNNSGWFSASMVDELDSPFFGADGCYVGGWWSYDSDNNVLDMCVSSNWYGSSIFTSEHVRVMVLGMLSQSGFSFPVSFIENSVPGLLEGLTLADSMIDRCFLGDIVIYGDPSFCFSF